MTSSRTSLRLYFFCVGHAGRLASNADALDTVGCLKLAHELNDLQHRSLAHLRLRGHVAETPMMLGNAAFGSQDERGIGMMAGLVDLMDKRWSLVRATRKSAMTGSAVFLKHQLPSLSWSGELGKDDIDRAAGAIRSEPPKTGNHQQRRSQSPKSWRSLRSLHCHGVVSLQLNKNRFHQLEGQGT